MKMNLNFSCVHPTSSFSSFARTNKVLVCGGSSCRLLDLRLDQSDLIRAGVCTGGPESSPVRTSICFPPGGMNKLQNRIKGAFSIYSFQSRVPCLLVVVLSSLEGQPLVSRGKQMILLNISTLLKTRGFSLCACRLGFGRFRGDSRFGISHQSQRNSILNNEALILVSQDYKIVFDSSWWPPPGGTMSTCFVCCC